MDRDFGQRRVQVTREWFEMVRPLYDKSPETFDLLYLSILGFALRADTFGEDLAFADEELQSLLEKTIIRKCTPERPALIDIKPEGDE